MAIFRGDFGGVAFKISNSNPNGKVCLWDVHNNESTIHMDRTEALRMVKTILDIVEDNDAILPSTRRVTTSF